MSEGRRRSRDEASYTFLRGATWWARFTVNGKEFRGSLHTREEQAARIRAGKWRDREVAAAKFGECRKTYSEVYDAWALFITSQVGVETVKRYTVSLDQIEPFLTPLFLDEIDRDLVAEIVRQRRAAGVTVATIRRDLTALSSLLEFAIDEGWRPDESNPALARGKRLREVREPIMLPLAEDIAFVLSRVRGTFGRLIEAAILTGCRQDELVKAERRMFDAERRQMTIRRKGNQIRTITLSVDAAALLAALPAHLKGKWLFWHGDGQPYSKASARFAEHIKSAQKAAHEQERPFRPFTFHHLRHYYAVHFLKNGGNIYALQQHLNHKSIVTTEGYLDFLTPEEAAAAKLGTSQNAEQWNGL